jgi:hypothetical protein
MDGICAAKVASPSRFKHLYVRNFLGANYLVILEQQGVITSLLPALPHDYFPGSWTAAPERITVGHKTRFLCQTDRMEATVVALRPFTRGITLPPLEDEYPPVNEARCSNQLLEHLEHLHETNDLFGGDFVYPEV